MSWDNIKKSLSSLDWMAICSWVIVAFIIFGGIKFAKTYEPASDFSYEMKEVELSDGSYVNCLVTKDGNDHTMQCDWQHRTVKGHSYE